jgi:hypothetical protein
MNIRMLRRISEEIVSAHGRYVVPEVGREWISLADNAIEDARGLCIYVGGCLGVVRQAMNISSRSKPL